MVRRSGFTIIEVLVALVVSGIILLGARALLDATADHAGKITAAAAAADREANAERTLAALVERLEVGGGNGAAFAGDPATASFTSWCDVAGGWEERCAVTIGLEKDSLGNSLIARTSVGNVLRLKHGFRVGTIRYIASAESGGTWIRVWGAGQTAPMAIAIILDKDTLLVRVGERG